MKCTRCGAEVDAGQRFCASCGTPVETATHCTNCGAQLAPGATFCANCGVQVGAVGVPMASRAAPVAAQGPIRRPALETTSFGYKGLGWRLVGGLVDLILFYVFAALLASRLGGTATSSTSDGFEFSFNLQGPNAVYIFALWLAYFVLLEGFLGWTIGKLILGMRVVNAEGRAPGLIRALIRNLLRPIDYLLIGIILIAVSERKRRLGDLIAGTFVVSPRGAAAMRAATRAGGATGGALAVVAVGLLVLVGGWFFWSSQPDNPMAKFIGGLTSGSESPITKVVSDRTATPAQTQPTGQQQVKLSQSELYVTP